MHEGRVLPKLVVLVLVAAATAATLLAIRQRRVEAAHELARIQSEIASHDKAIWRLRLEIAGRVKPSEVRHMAGAIGPLAPIYSDECEEPIAVGSPSQRAPSTTQTAAPQKLVPTNGAQRTPTAPKGREAR